MSFKNFEREFWKDTGKHNELITFRQHSVKEAEEEKLMPDPITRTKSHNIEDKWVSDRFIPWRSYLESSYSLIASNVDQKPGKSYSSDSDSSREDISSIQNYNALLENQFFGGDDALNEINLSWLNNADIVQPDFTCHSNMIGGSKAQKRKQKFTKV